MKQISIGTLLPGGSVEAWLPYIVKAGFENVSITFHMSLDNMDLKELAKRVRDIIGDSGVKVSTLGYYCNPLDNDDHKKTLEQCIDVAGLFGTSIVSTFAGAIEGKSVDASMGKFGQVFGELSKRASDKGVSIALENCPMGGTWEHATCNIAFNPRAWDMMFNEVPAENLGLQWEPAHQMVQLIDPVAQLRQWAGKVINVHGKDANMDLDAVKKYGVFGAAEFAVSRTPGFGDTNWRDVISILQTNGYEGDIVIEGYHDPIYNGEWEMTGQLHALRYLKWCRGGDFVPNP